MISTRCKLIFETIGFLDFTSLGFPEGWSHCQLPSICSSKSSQQTVYFASRNSERKSSIYKIKMLVHGSDVTFKTSVASITTLLPIPVDSSIISLIETPSTRST